MALPIAAHNAHTWQLWVNYVFYYSTIYTSNSTARPQNTNDEWRKSEIYRVWSYESAVLAVMRAFSFKPMSVVRTRCADALTLLIHAVRMFLRLPASTLGNSRLLLFFRDGSVRSFNDHKYRQKWIIPSTKYNLFLRYLTFFLWHSRSVPSIRPPSIGLALLALALCTPPPPTWAMDLFSFRSSSAAVDTKSNIRQAVARK